MSAEEPAWRAQLRRDIRDALAKSDGYEPDWLSSYSYQDETAAVLRVLDSHIQAAEQRGRREALTAFICGACGHRVGWIDCPTGGWWAHEVHPTDNHDATQCVPELP